jgi:hypothetical protein
MKRIFTLLIIGLFATTSTFAQERYLDEVFTDVTVTSDVVYGDNATVLYFSAFGEAVPIPLTMDIYQPEGDTETNRPVVMVYHTGNFLPLMLNGGITGGKTDSAAVEMCTQLAKKGYVAASVTYRTGWNPLADNQPTRALGLIQAAYRGIQDGRNAIRFFRSDADNGNQYGIDPNKMVAWGYGTGGYLTLGLATLDDYLEIPQSANGPGKFLLDINMDGIPETPMVVPQYHGDINGEVLTITPDGAFGLPAGDTTNYPNYVGYSSDINLVVNIGGALGDVSWIDENTAPIVTVQSAFDMFAPYEDGVLVVPTTGDDIVRVQGGLNIHRTLEAAGNNDIFKDADFNTTAWASDVSAAAEANSVTAEHEYIKTLYPITNPPNSGNFDEGLTVDWWDPNALSPPVTGFPNGLPWNILPHPSGGTFHTQGLILNEGMSAEKSITKITDYINFVTPRACVALDLPCKALFVDTDVKDLVLDASILSISPNPASTSINISVKGENIESIAIFAMDGKLMMKESNVNSENITIQRNNLPTGIYFVKAFLERGVATQKVVFE